MSQSVFMYFCGSRCKTAALILVSIALVIAGLVESANALHPPEASTELPLAAKSTTSSLPIFQGGQGRQRVEAELIAILPTGFEPSEVTRHKGSFLLVVDNRTGLVDISLNLSLAGNTKRQTRLVNRRKWKEIVDLPPGKYILTEVSHPDWQCQITIAP